MSKMKKILSLVMVGIMAIGMTACSSKKADSGSSVKDVPISEVHTAVKEAYGDTYYPNMECWSSSSPSSVVTGRCPQDTVGWIFLVGGLFSVQQ